MGYERVRVVSDAEVIGDSSAAGLLFLFDRIPSLRLALALICLYLPLWWLMGLATEYSGGLILSPVLGVVASIAVYWLLRKLFLGYAYDPVLAVLIALLLGIAVLGGVGATVFGHQHRDDLWGVGLLYVAALVVLFTRFRDVVKRVLSPVFRVMHLGLVLCLALPLVAGSARLLVRSYVPRSVEVPLVKVQFFGGPLIGWVYMGGDEQRARTQCEVGRMVVMSEGDVRAGKPVPDDGRRASCRVMSPFQPAFRCPDENAQSQVHDSVRRVCESWRRDHSS